MHLFLIDDNETIYAFGNNNEGQLGVGDKNSRFDNFYNVNIRNPIKYVSVGELHSVAIDIYDHIWACGINSEGQLGLGDDINRNIFVHVPFERKITSVSCGTFHTAILDNYGTLWVCAGNSLHNDISSQLGLGEITGTNLLTPVPSNVIFRSVFCGDLSTATIDQEGKLWVCGDNLGGRLGLGDQNDRRVLTQVDIDVSFVQVAFGEWHI